MARPSVTAFLIENMKEFTISKNIPYGTAEALRAIQQNLQGLDTPLLNSKKELNNLEENQSGYYFEDGQLYRYINIKGKLHREAVDDKEEYNFLSELDD